MFSFDLESIYDAFYPPVLKLGSRKFDEADKLVIWVTGKNLSYLLQIWLGTDVLFWFSILLRCFSSSCGQIRM